VKGFKEFVAGGSLVEVAVAFVLGAATAALVTALVGDLITPIIAAIAGSSDFSALNFKVNGSKFSYGHFINALITFLTIAAAMYFFVVVPYEKFMARRRAGQPATTKECPECLSEIPAGARKCSFCGSAQTTVN